jgi:hypothetical protein
MKVCLCCKRRVVAQYANPEAFHSQYRLAIQEPVLIARHLVFIRLSLTIQTS